MSVYYDHDIFRVPPCKKTPREQYIVRPHGPKGTPGVRGEYDTYTEAYDQVHLMYLWVHLPEDPRLRTAAPKPGYRRCIYYDQKCTCGGVAVVPSDCT